MALWPDEALLAQLSLMSEPDWTWYDQVGLSGRPYGEKGYWFGFWERFLRARIAPEAPVLECGAGLGFLLRRLAPYFTTYGLDLSGYALERAKLRSPSSRLCQATAMGIPFAPNSFEAVLALEMIEHVADPGFFLKEAKRVLRAGGWAIVTTPNPGSLGARLKKRRPEWRGRPQAERMREWHGWRDDSHISVMSMAQWRALFRDAGLEIQKAGTTALHDIPYFAHVPLFIEKALFTTTFVGISATFGFLPWPYGETIVLCARKPHAS